MISKYFDLQVGIRKIKRAEATLLRRRSGDLSGLQRSELVECTWALSTILVAVQQGARLAPEVLALAESVAHSRTSTFTDCDPAIRVSSPCPAHSGHSLDRAATGLPSAFPTMLP